MSGIAGILSPNNQQIVSIILNNITHRGTSSPKIWKSPKAALGAIGLSSLNEEPGPVITRNGKQAVVMDGSIGNQHLLYMVSEFNNDSGDTGTDRVLHDYTAHVANIFGLIHGKYALAIAGENQFILARDHLGIQPLYYGFHDGALCFTSEIKGLLGIVNEVHEFPPGHFMLSDKGIYPYKPYTPKPVQIDGPVDSSEIFANHLRSSVRKAIPKGAAVGVWLSGGVDSSVIAALARSFVDRLYTFSAGVEGAPDLEYAKKVAQHIDSEHHERIYNLAEMLDVLEKTIYHLESFDAPLVNSAVSNYLVSELAADHVPFVFSGEGGDELLAGYTYQKTYNINVQLTLSIQETIAALHNTALQRVDRSATAHSIGVDTPFLDSDVVRYSLAIPSHWKIHGSDMVDKWPLRNGFADILPEEVVWRDKSKFWEGSGTGAILAKHAEGEISDQEFNRYRTLENGSNLRSKEELMYYRIFKQYFKDSIPLNEVGRTQHI
jgi:asparagine synthase (glutamine-hydrolysing)